MSMPWIAGRAGAKTGFNVRILMSMGLTLLGGHPHQHVAGFQLGLGHVSRAEIGFFAKGMQEHCFHGFSPWVK